MIATYHDQGKLIGWALAGEIAARRLVTVLRECLSRNASALKNVFHGRLVGVAIRTLVRLTPPLDRVDLLAERLRYWHLYWTERVVAMAMRRVEQDIEADYERARREMNVKAGQDWRNLLS